MLRRPGSAALAFALAIASTLRAHAQSVDRVPFEAPLPAATDVSASAPTTAPEPEAPKGQDNFGIGVELGAFNPTGLALRAGTRAVSLELAGGVAPLLLSYGPSTSPTLKFLMPLEGTAQLLIHVLTFPHDVHGVLHLGYRYNAALGHGASLGAHVSKRLTPHVQLEGLGGLAVYPNATTELRGREVSPHETFRYPPEMGGGLSVGILLFP